MTDRTPLSMRTDTIGGKVLTKVASSLAVAALSSAAKLAKNMADRRGGPRLRGEAIYRDLDKVRVVGEVALTLDNESNGDERQRIAAQSAALRDILHEQLADLRLFSSSQTSVVLDAAQTAISDADRLVAALNRWALKSPDAAQTQALQQEVQAISASENVLLSCMDKARRRRPSKG